jgi:ribonucleoside-diphosphate reductase alpha chain
VRVRERDLTRRSVNSSAGGDATVPVLGQARHCGFGGGMQRGAQETVVKAVDQNADPARRPSSRGARGLEFPRYFTQAGADPFDAIEWDRRDALIANDRGDAVFEQRGVETPRSWSQQATNIVVSKYFRGELDTSERESSVRQLIGRVVDTITGWARSKHYFADETDLVAFSDDMKHLLVYQKASFNSPVWFNCGIEKHPQCSACFINSVDDTLDSILTLAKTEGMLFKFGSGTGSNLSNLRSSRESLAGGGTASGPVSFMKGYDAFAGVIKSGGKTRRAAKMVILNADHPDIAEFIRCKVEEEKKAWALIDAGYDGSFTGQAYASVFFQNSNNSVRVTDDFMRAAMDNGIWQTRAIKDRTKVMDSYNARDLLRQIADATHVCGDPGMQFDTTVNEWHTCPNSDRINASNPCSEYMFLDDSACNLASLT